MAGLAALLVAASLSPSSARAQAGHDVQRASATVAPGCPTQGTRDVTWMGMVLLRGGKGYADTPMGQVHYRRAGPRGGLTLVLLHQTPWSMIQFAEVQACLAELGVASLPIDTPGYGLSDGPAGHPSVEDYADNLAYVLDVLDLDRVVLAGHHTGAAIAASFGARHVDRTAGLLLHGVPLYTGAERASRIAAPERSRALSEDGHHLSDYYRYIRDYAGSHPRTMVTANWSTIHWNLAAGSDVAHEAVFHHDLASDLDRLAAPVLVLSDSRDSLRANDLRTTARHPAFRFRTFSEGGAHALMLDPAGWARIAADFVAGIEGSSSGD